jgi:uncharacterized membrane protein
VRARLWAAGAAAWTIAFIVLAYVRFHPQPWYVAIVAVAGMLALPAAVLGAGRGRTALLFALGILVIAALLGGWAAGPVLLPAIVAAALAVKASQVPVSGGGSRK